MFDKRIYTQHVMQNILANFFDGSFSGMVSFLCEQGDIPTEETKTAARIIRLKADEN